MKSIETGVDKLVGLIEQKKKISLDEAAKKLGVGSVLVQEWADFLEEDGLIGIEYSLSKVWLVERKLTKKEVQKKTKEYSNKKDSFIRKVETTLKTMEKETMGFEKMKEEFDSLQKDMGGEIGYVKKDLEELEYFENLKNNIDKDIIKQKTEYEKLMSISHQQIKEEEKRYREMIAKVDQERLKVTKGKKALITLDEQEKLLEQKVAEVAALVETIRKKVATEEHDIEVSGQNAKKLELFVSQIEKRMKNKKHEAILPLVRLSEEHSNKIMNIQEKILEKLKQKKGEIDEFKGQKKQVYGNLKKFFEKKAATEKLMADIDKHKKTLQHEYEELMKKAQAFNAISKDATVKKHVAELEGTFNKIEKHKSALSSQISKLSKLIKG